MTPSFTHAVSLLQSVSVARFMRMLSTAAVLASVTTAAGETWEGSTRREVTHDSCAV
jgi:hypothetical protein